MPVASTLTNRKDPNRSMGTNDDEIDDDDDDDHRWYRPRSSSPPLSSSRFTQMSNNSVHHQSSSSATMGSWGFDVNRSTNGQTSSSLTSNNSNNNHDYRTITRTPKRFNETIEDYHERRTDRSPASFAAHPPPPPAPPPQRFKLRTPTMTRHRNTTNSTLVDRSILGPSRVVQPDYYPSDDSSRQPQVQPSAIRSRQSSTRSILRRRSKSIGDFVTSSSSSPPPSQSLTESYHQYRYHDRPETSSTKPYKGYTEHELLAWQNRMLERFVVSIGNCTIEAI
jgi:hypothetical protein